MGLDDLVARIELLQARIRSHKIALRENETRTRMALIDPLMHALGWDVSDPEATYNQREPACKTDFNSTPNPPVFNYLNVKDLRLFLLKHVETDCSRVL